MKKILILLSAALVMQTVPVVIAPASAQQIMGIAAVVNDEAISMTDVDDRIRLVLVSSGLQANKEIYSKVAPQVIESLIEEQLKMQEAARYKLKVSDEEVAEGFNTIASQNKLNGDQFRAAMKQQGVPIKTLERQIRTQLAWNKVIREVYRKQVDVSDRDVNNRIERLKAQIGKTEYLVSEIFLPIEDSKRAKEVQEFAGRMAAELQAKKAPFGPVAVQFSKAAGAENGGVIGWVQEGHLDPVLEKVLLGMEEGQISNPIKTNSGLYLLNLQKKRTITEEALPPRDELKNQIGFERLDRVQQKALLDMKTSAFIDRRV